MKRFFATFVTLAAAVRLAAAQLPDTYQPGATNTSASSHVPSTAKPAKSSHPASTNAQAMAAMQASLDQLSKSNHDLLDLLKQQQSVLEDMQYDRRLQSRQIDNLEERLEETYTEKQQLQQKVDELEAQATMRPAIVTTVAAPPPIPTPNTPTPPQTPPPSVPVVTSVDSPDTSPPPEDTTPAPPATYLPPAGDNPPGMESWHRIVQLKGSENQQTGVFTVHGKLWRVLWHNQDKPGKLYANTSALFINAFPRDDTIPERVCSKLGTGGDSVEMQGSGNYYLKIEASGGSWELAVEDYY